MKNLTLMAAAGLFSLLGNIAMAADDPFAALSPAAVRRGLDPRAV